jgi:hypothetical protein
LESKLNTLPVELPLRVRMCCIFNNKYRGTIFIAMDFKTKKKKAMCHEKAIKTQHTIIVHFVSNVSSIERPTNNMNNFILFYYFKCTIK